MNYFVVLNKRWFKPAINVIGLIGIIIIKINIIKFKLIKMINNIIININLTWIINKFNCNMEKNVIIKL